MKIEWSLEKRKLSSLKGFPKNPRTLSKEQHKQLKACLDKFGLIDKPCINTDNTIIGGHQRIHILSSQVKEIEVWVPSRFLEEKEVEELNIRLNANQGEWDQDILANEWDLYDLVQWGINELKTISETIQLENSEPTQDKKKKLKQCPQCGCEF